MFYNMSGLFYCCFSNSVNKLNKKLNLLNCRIVLFLLCQISIIKLKNDSKV